MSKRQKIVFSSNNQLAHVWAQQTQSNGRTGNMFFESNTIYSYGYHYKIARIVTVRGKSMCFINANGYSNTTSRHTGDVVNAVSGLMPWFYVPGMALDCSPLKMVNAAVKRLKTSIDNEIKHALKKIKIVNVTYAFNNFKNRINDDVKAIHRLTGKTTFKVNKADIDAVKEHYKRRAARYAELNSPEMIAKREATAIKRKEVKQAKEIKEFREGKRHSVQGMSHELLRKNSEEVVTSRGARVSLVFAQRAYNIIKKRGVKALLNKHIGHFTVNKIEHVQGDTVLHIGCHRIKMSEIKNVMEAK